jgi:hypothetical protein
MATTQMIPAKDFCSHHHIEITFLHSLHDYGLIALFSSDDEVYLEPEEVIIVEKLVRLHYDLHINLEGLDVIQGLLERQNELTKEIAALHNKLSFYEARQTGF